MIAPILPVSPTVNSVFGPPQGQWTYAAWENLPDDGNRYEIIDGVLYMSTSLSLHHQWIIQQLYELLALPAKRQNLAYTYLAPVGVIMPGMQPVQPDFVLVLAGRSSIFHDKRIRGVPDLIVEVLSPGNRDYDEGVKLAAYAKAGVPEYGVIDPAARQFRLYRLQQPGEYSAAQAFNAGDSVTLACLPTIPVPVSDLFAGSPDTTL